MDDTDGVWRTISGRRIFLKDGQDLHTAMAQSGKFGEDIGKDKSSTIKARLKKQWYDEFSNGSIRNPKIVEHKRDLEAKIEYKLVKPTEFREALFNAKQSHPAIDAWRVDTKHEVSDYENFKNIILRGGSTVSVIQW